MAALTNNYYVDIASTHFLIAGVVRNGGPKLYNRIKSLVDCFKNCGKISVLVVESDSSDDTVAVLKRLSTENSFFRYTSLGSLSCRFPLRTQRLAFCRNYYLNALNNLELYEDVDFLVVADLDGVNDLLRSSSLSSCWSSTAWDACFANQLGPYYDIWALRHPLWSPNDCLRQVDFMKTIGSDEFSAIFGSVLSRMRVLPPNSPWIPVESAFGGLAIYKKSAIGNALYVGLDPHGNEVCEHVQFHQDFISRGKHLYIVPSLINSSYDSRTKYSSGFGLIRYFLQSSLRHLNAYLTKSLLCL